MGRSDKNLAHVHAIIPWQTMHLPSRGLLPLLLAAVATPASGGKNLTIVWGTHDLVVQETEALCYRIECARARRAHIYNITSPTLAP